MKDANERKCRRTAPRSVYEHDDPKDREWWTTLFHKMEVESSIPPDRRLEVIRELFPRIEEGLKEILSFEPLRDSPLGTEPAVTHQKKYYDTPGSLTSLQMMQDLAEEEAEDGALRRNATANNPYIQFFRTRPDRAAIWHVLPPLSLDEMNLTQKATVTTENIAENFYAWLKNVGGDEPPPLDVETIIKMFEIGFNYHAATSLCVRVKELPAISDSIAKKRNLPGASFRANLHRQLKRDLKTYRTQEKQVAFGKILPLEMRPMLQSEDFASKWLDCKRVPTDLATMAAVWEGIEHLRSTRAFCGWLLEHPEIPPPIYLEDKGMLNFEYLAKPHHSIDSIGDTVIPRNEHEMSAGR